VGLAPAAAPRRFPWWAAKTALLLLLATPLAVLVARGVAEALGANPVEEVLRETGIWALRLLLVTLAITPLRRLTGWGWLLRFRRMIGVSAFVYALLHFLTFVVVDQGLDLAELAESVVKRPYITVGFTALVLLVPLAATSTDGMVRRLGGRRWKRLHQLVYVVAVLACLHYLWLVKADTLNPLVYTGVLVALLALRLPGFSRIGPARAHAP
jgi:sulfoxide reductase heme-binding subunit YedZ